MYVNRSSQVMVCLVSKMENGAQTHCARTDVLDVIPSSFSLYVLQTK